MQDVLWREELPGMQRSGRVENGAIYEPGHMLGLRWKEGMSVVRRKGLTSHRVGQQAR